MIVIGITGSIGMGKSTVAGWMRDMGIPVHDSDQAVHGLLAAGGAAVADVAEVFPEALQQDAAGQKFIDRKILGQIVFAAPDLKKKLEGILHPLVRQDSDAFLHAARQSGHAMAVLDIPLLFETGGEGRVDTVICVTAPLDVQRARVLSRIGMTAEKFTRILAGQMPDAEKRARADYILDTSLPNNETRAQLKDILENISKGKIKRHDPRNHP